MKRPVTSFERFLDAQDEQALYLLWQDVKINKNGGEAKTADGSVNNEMKNGGMKIENVKNGGDENFLCPAQDGSTNVLLGYLRV